MINYTKLVNIIPSPMMDPGESILTLNTDGQWNLTQVEKLTIFTLTGDIVFWVTFDSNYKVILSNSTISDLKLILPIFKQLIGET